MKFDKHFPVDFLTPYIRYYVVSESEREQVYKVFPTTGLVMGFQYKGGLSMVLDTGEDSLSSAGITGLSDRFKRFRNTAQTGTILVYFTEIGFTHFAAQPANELFGLSLSLEQLFPKDDVEQVEERLSRATGDLQRIKVIERFLTNQLKDRQTDRLIVEAVRRIHQSSGTIRMRELAAELCISQSPLEKRFRKVVGTTPKKFASIVRLNAVMDQLGEAKTLTEICYEHQFFDQAHFIKDFKQFTGETPEHFRRFL